MTKSEKNTIIHDLIKENPETTIKDYIQLLCELADIAAAESEKTKQQSFVL
jgi:hypothetical protein